MHVAGIPLEERLSLQPNHPAFTHHGFGCRIDEESVQNGAHVIQRNVSEDLDFSESGWQDKSQGSRNSFIIKFHAVEDIVRGKTLGQRQRRWQLERLE